MDFMAVLGTLWAPIATLLAAIILIDQAYTRIMARLRPATSIPARLKKVEEEINAAKEAKEKFSTVMDEYEKINKLQCKAMLDIMLHMKDGNHVENMNKTIKEIESILVDI